MTTQEFSIEFDILYNNIMSNAAPGLNEYEKSVFLTKAQEEVIISLYNGKNPSGDSFEKTEEIRRCLNELIESYSVKLPDEGIFNKGLSPYSKFYDLPSTGLWFITYESAILKDEKLGCLNGEEVPVIPVTQDDFQRIKDNPFTGPNKNRVLRLDYSLECVELVSKFNIEEYRIRYIKKPSPIILEDLSKEGLTINGENKITECKLNPVIHRAILDRAVALAKAAYVS